MKRFLKAFLKTIIEFLAIALVAVLAILLFGDTLKSPIVPALFVLAWIALETKFHYDRESKE